MVEEHIDVVYSPPILGTIEEEKEIPNKVVWRSFCLAMDKDFVVYITTFTLIAMVVVFCFYQLIHMESCSDQQAYLSVLSMILGVLLPQPRLK
jgi:hypothetical protein